MQYVTYFLAFVHIHTDKIPILFRKRLLFAIELWSFFLFFYAYYIWLQRWLLYKNTREKAHSVFSHSLRWAAYLIDFFSMRYFFESQSKIPCSSSKIPKFMFSKKILHNQYQIFNDRTSCSHISMI